MAGHSKWDNIKHKKQKEDARRGKIFTKVSREISVAAREGGGDPETNFRLRLAVEKAKGVNMPAENIERAIKRATGGMEGDSYEEIVYEGYGPGGVAVLLQVMTDNRNRTASDLRSIFSRQGGNLGETGCVAWMFHQKGLLVADDLPHDGDEDEVLLAALEAGAEDVDFEDGSAHILTAPGDLHQVKAALEEQNFAFSTVQLTMRPQNTVEVDAAGARSVLRLLETLEDHDDVQEVHANVDITDDVMQALQTS